MVADDTKQIMLVHAVLVGLTPLIPIPILDDYVKNHIERRLTSELARKRGVELDEKAVATLTGDEDGSMLGSIAKSVVTFPFKLIFRKLFVVLEVKRASDEASRSFHRAYLLDRALAWDAVGPKGTRTYAELRKAIDATCRDTSLSPIGRAIYAVLLGSKDLLAKAGKGLLDAIRREKRAERVAPEDVARAVDETKKAAVAPIVERLKAAIDALPSEHFQELDRKLAMYLAFTPPSPPSLPAS